MNEEREREFIERNMRTNPDISRRRLMDWMLKSGWGLSAAAVLSTAAVSACAIPPSGIGAGGGQNGGFGGGSDTIKIPVIGPFSGIGSFVGAIIERSLAAAVPQINENGGIGGRKVETIVKDISAADAQQVINAYQDIAGQGDVAGIVWGVPGGIVELADRINTDQLLIAAAFVDLASDDQLYPHNDKLRSVFQFLIPDKWAVKVLADYCKNDRGFGRVGLIFDNTTGGGVEPLYKDAMSAAGLASTGIATYQLNNSNFGPQISAVGNPQSLWMWGLATDIANAVKQLADAGKDYIDINTAKTGARPQLMGSPAALGEKKWAELAGQAAKAGTLCAWHVGGLIYLPTFKMRQWMQKYTSTTPTGGEETPADALYMVANAVKNAGGAITDRAALIKAVEGAGKQEFSSVDFEFTDTNHLARHPDDLIIVTLERAGKPATPNYKLGREWTEVFPPGYVGPTHLVRPTLEANTRRYPDVMKVVVEDGWGTQAPPGDPTH